MRISSTLKLYFGILLSIIVFIICTHLSSNFENKWLILFGNITAYLFAAYLVLGSKFELPKTKNEHKISPKIIFYISIGVLGLYFILEWQFKISIAILLKSDYVDIMTYNITLFKIIKTVLIFPIMEELFFRRIISQKIYLSNGFYPALWVSSILFSLSHVYSDTNLIGALIGGIFFGYIYLRTSNIWLSIIAHALFNALILFVSPQISDLILGISEYWVFGVLIIISLGLIFTMTYFMNRIKENKGLNKVTLDLPTGNKS